MSVKSYNKGTPKKFHGGMYSEEISAAWQTAMEADGYDSEWPWLRRLAQDRVNEHEKKCKQQIIIKPDYKRLPGYQVSINMAGIQRVEVGQGKIGFALFFMPFTGDYFRYCYSTEKAALAALEAMEK